MTISHLKPEETETVGGHTGHRADGHCAYSPSRPWCLVVFVPRGIPGVNSDSPWETAASIEGATSPPETGSQPVQGPTPKDTTRPVTCQMESNSDLQVTLHPFSRWSLAAGPEVINPVLLVDNMETHSDTAGLVGSLGHLREQHVKLKVRALPPRPKGKR